MLVDVYDMIKSNLKYDKFIFLDTPKPHQPSPMAMAKEKEKEKKRKKREKKLIKEFKKLFKIFYVSAGHAT